MPRAPGSGIRVPGQRDPGPGLRDQGLCAPGCGIRDPVLGVVCTRLRPLGSNFVQSIHLKQFVPDILPLCCFFAALNFAQFCFGQIFFCVNNQITHNTCTMQGAACPGSRLLCHISSNSLPDILHLCCFFFAAINFVFVKSCQMFFPGMREQGSGTRGCVQFATGHPASLLFFFAAINFVFVKSCQMFFPGMREQGSGTRGCVQFATGHPASLLFFFAAINFVFVKSCQTFFPGMREQGSGTRGCVPRAPGYGIQCC
jgi:hypothetical protein